jgi:hypothetical protein
MNEIEELMSFRTSVDGAAPRAVARVRARLDGLGLADISAGRRRRRTAWLAMPAAAAAVLAVSLALALTTSPGPAPTGPNPSTVPGTASVAADRLEALARLAEAQPPPPSADGKLIESVSRIVKWKDERGRSPSQTLHFDPQGFIQIDQIPGADPNFEQHLKAQRDRFAADGPSPLQPSPSWLASVDTSVAGLTAVVQQWIEQSGESGPVNPIAVTRFYGLLSVHGGILLPPKVVAGFLRLLAAQSGVDVADATFEGHGMVAVSVTVPNSGVAKEIYLDPATGRALGDGTLTTISAGDVAACIASLSAGSATNDEPVSVASYCPTAPTTSPIRSVGTWYTTTLVDANQ